MSAVSRRKRVDRFETEADLVNAIIPFLQSEGHKVRREVPNLSQSVDIVATRGRWVTFIEAKMHNWRRGLHQCRGHLNVADYLCLVLGSKRIPPELEAKAKHQGYGIIRVDPRNRKCGWFLRPRLNRGVWPAERKRWARTLRKIDYAG